VKQVIPKDSAMVDISIQQVLASIPEEWRQRYLAPNSEPDPTIEFRTFQLANGKQCIKSIPKSMPPGHEK
jgi:hypothetical protein